MKIKELKKRLQKEVNPAWVWVLAITTVIFSFIVYSYLAEPRWLPQSVNDFSKKIVDELILGQTDSNKTEDQDNRIENKEEFSRTNDIDTSSWQTYENKELGFSIKYPEDWKNTHYSEGFIGLSPSDLFEDNVVILEIKNSTTLEEELNKKVSIIKDNPNQEFISKERLSLNDNDARAIKSRNMTNNLISFEYFLEKNNKIYILSGDFNYENAEKIIKSFMLL